MVKDDEVDEERSGVVDKLSKIRKVVKKLRNCQKSEKPQRPGKFAKTIGSEKRLLKHQSSVDLIQKTRAPVKTLIVVQALLLSLGALLILRLERLLTRKS